MILRRVIAHVGRQEWTAIGIDLVIVVLGVFIGIQVSNWNVERETNARGAIFAERLKADLQEEAWYYQLQIEYSRDVLANAERAVAGLAGKAADADEALLISAYRSREGMQSRYREAFRMSLPNEIQRALARNCGDHYVRAGDYKGLDDLIDYPCRTGLPAEAIDGAVTALRANATLVPLLRLRIADIETRLVDLTGNNREIMQGLQAIATERR